jgi:dimethylhistidine N-methyltransferase
MDAAFRARRRAEAPDAPPATEGFLEDVFQGLSKSQKQLPCKYFYDEAGSRLFDRICELDEYYPTRTEIGLLKEHGGEIAELVGGDVCLIEFGCGSLVKTRLLLDALTDPGVFVPIDISREHLLRAAAQLNEDYAELEVLPVVADFTRALALPAAVEADGRRRVAFFPGSTIGNLDHDAAGAFLGRAARMVGPDGGLLIGVDLKKDEKIILRAYDDAAGVTAAFNLNILARINRELEADFDLDGFEHRAVYNDHPGRIEIYLVSRREQAVRVRGRTFRFRAGETIHTENSYKYGVREFQDMAARRGFRSARTWVDGGGLFSLHYFSVG